MRQQCRELNARYAAGVDLTMSSLPSLTMSSLPSLTMGSLPCLEEPSSVQPSLTLSSLPCLEEHAEEHEEPLLPQSEPVESASPTCVWELHDPMDTERVCSSGTISEAFSWSREARVAQPQVGPPALPCAKGSEPALVEGSRRPLGLTSSQICSLLDTNFPSENSSSPTTTGHCGETFTVVSTREPSPCERGWAIEDAAYPAEDPCDSVDPIGVAMMEWRQRREQRREQRRISAKVKRTYGVWLRERADRPDDQFGAGNSHQTAGWRTR